MLLRPGERVQHPADRAAERSSCSMRSRRSRGSGSRRAGRARRRSARWRPNHSCCPRMGSGPSSGPGPSRRWRRTARLPGEFDDPRPVLGRLGDMVGLDAHRGEEPAMSRGDLDHGARCPPPSCRWRGSARAPAAAGPTEHALPIALQPGVVQVGVGVDEGRSGDRRGMPAVPPAPRPIRAVLISDQLEAVAGHLETLAAEGFQRARGRAWRSARGRSGWAGRGPCPCGGSGSDSGRRRGRRIWPSSPSTGVSLVRRRRWRPGLPVPCKPWPG